MGADIPPRNLIDQFERELNLARSPRSAANEAKAGAANGIRRQTKIDDIEEIEKFRPKFDDAQFIFPAAAKRSVLDQRKIHLMKCRTSKSVTAKRAKPSLIGPAPAGNANRNREK